VAVLNGNAEAIFSPPPTPMDGLNPYVDFFNDNILFINDKRLIIQLDHPNKSDGQSEK